MKNNTKVKRKFSPEAIERMRTGALARFDSEAKKTHDRIRAVMLNIQQEMAANEGIYPHNEGALSKAEVARRADIHPFTFHKPRYRDLGTEVTKWLKTLKQGAVVGRGRVRKELGTRVQEWKQLYEDLLETHRITETDLEYANEQLKDAMRQNDELRQRLAALTRQKVIPLNLNKD